uniref:Uncharacterized protein n=1 Tax=Haemonchus contortus TaxID=6289 RepID=A0A7I4YRX9_HAECO
MLFKFVTIFLLPLCIRSQVNLSPLMGFLNPDNMSRMADLAVQLSSLAAQSMAKNEKDVARTVDDQRELPLGLDARPSQVLGQTVSDVTTQSRLSFLKAFAPLDRSAPDPALVATTPPPPPPPMPTTFFPEWGQLPDGSPAKHQLNIKPIDPIRRAAPRQLRTYASQKYIVPASSNDLKSVGDTIRPLQPVNAKSNSALEDNPLLRLASTFLRGATGDSNQSSGTIKTDSDGLPDFGGIRDYVPGAKENFGIRKGPGCLPFLSEVMQVAYGNCQQVADEKAFDAWGDELKSAILTGKIDLLKASQETCRRGAERQQCGALRRAISNCDILESLQIGAQLQRAMKRCEEVSGLVDQNPLVILSQINRLVGGEFAQGFLNKFLGGGK